MTTEPDPNREDALLDAVLGGESWAEVNAAAKHAALAEFHARQRRRRLQFWAMAAAACAVLAGGAVWLRPRVAPNKSLQAAVPPSPPSVSSEQISAVTTRKSPVSAQADPANLPQHITEAQMLALFPKGSCIIAEIDGQTQLIFFDHKIEEEGAPYQPGS
jgi:hypothetical protein